MTAPVLDLHPGKRLGKRLLIFNLVTRETAPFTLQEIIEYKGQFILVGNTGRHGIRIVPGVREVKPRIGVCVLLPGEDRNLVLRLSRKLHGLPLGLSEGQAGIWSGRTGGVDEGAARMQVYPVLNSGSGRPTSYATARDIGAKLVDAYLLYKATIPLLIAVTVPLLIAALPAAPSSSPGA